MTENRMLDSLPADEYERVFKHFEPVHLARKRIIYEAGQAIRSAYFFQNGMASLLAVAEDGRTVQVAIVGSDGFVGVPIILIGAGAGSNIKSPVRVVTQTRVDALRIDAHQLIAHFNRDGNLREVLLRYAQLLQAQLVQSALCNPLHSIRQRLCRWLLICRDAIGSDSFELTQEDLATMLGRIITSRSKSKCDFDRAANTRKYVHTMLK